MAPPNFSPSIPWWKTLLVTILGAVASGVMQHYFGDTGAIVGAAVTTGGAHLLQSPLDQAK